MKTEKMLLCATLLWAGLGESVFAFYNPSEGRWLSRDPIGERAGNTLYGFCGNGGPAAYDRYGLFSHTVDWHYNVSPQSIIFSQYPNAEGLTRATERMKNVSSSRASGASCDTYTVVVWARYDIYFKEGVDPSVSRTFSGRTLEEHEIMHVTSYNWPLISFEDTFNNFPLCCGRKCKSRFEDWLNAEWIVALDQGERDSIAVDLSGEYPPNSPDIRTFQSELQTVEGRLARSRQAAASARMAYDRCVANP